MNGVPFNPDSLLDAVVLMFFAVCSIVTAGLPLWIKVRKIDSQVSNSHDENLRDEITRGFREVRADLSGLREELRTERIERIDGDKLRIVYGKAE